MFEARPGRTAADERNLATVSIHPIGTELEFVAPLDYEADLAPQPQPAQGHRVVQPLHVQVTTNSRADRKYALAPGDAPLPYGESDSEDGYQGERVTHGARQASNRRALKPRSSSPSTSNSISIG
jgi:hypothetical protein